MKNFYTKLIIILTFSFFAAAAAIFIFQKVMSNQSSFILFIYLWLIILCLGVLFYFIYTKLFIKSNFYENTTLDSKISYNINEISKIKKIGFWSYDAKTFKLDWSEGAYNIFEFDPSKEELTYEKFLNFLPLPEQQYLSKEFEASIKNNRNYNVVHTIITQRGNKKFVEEYANHYYDDFGNHLKSIGTVIDITQQKIYEHNIIQKTNEQKNILALFDQGDSVLFKWNNDEKWSIDFVSLSVVNLLGYSKEEFATNKIEYSLCIHKDDLLRVHEEVKEAITNDTVFFTHKPYRVVTKDGEIKWVNDYTVLAKDSQDNITHFLGYISDITDQITSTDKINQERIKYQRLLDLSSEIIYIIDHSGSIIEYSIQALNSLGYTQEEMKKLKVYDWDLYLNEQNLEKICTSKNDKPITIESKHKRKDGTIYDVELLAVKISLNDKKYIYVSARDVTKTNELTKYLREQKEEFEAIFNNSKDGIAVMDFEMRLLNFNNAYMRITGYSKEELLMKKCTSFTAPEDINRSKVAYDRLMKFGYIENFEKTYIKKDGKRIDINLTISVMKENNQLLMIVKDVSSLKMVEKQSRLASMGEMLGNIAHQWRQPLSVISTCASGLKLKSEFEQEIDQKFLFNSVDTIMEQTKYLSDTIDDFRNFLKGNTGFNAVNINEVIASSVNLVRSSMETNYVKLILDNDENIIIQGNASQLQQSIINILNNAKDILVEKNEQNDRYIFIKTQKDDELSLNVIIYDNGGGIDENIIERIFEPYFTTKHKTFGTGLGLSMAHQILVDKHHATLDVYNYQYKYNDKSYTGACFNIGFKIKE